MTAFAMTAPRQGWWKMVAATSFAVIALMGSAHVGQAAATPTAIPKVTASAMATPPVITSIPSATPTSSITQPTTTTTATSNPFPTIIITVSLALILLAFLIILAMPERDDDWRRRMRLVAAGGVGGATLLGLAAMMVELLAGSGQGATYAFVESYRWWTASVISTRYEMGLDGLSIALLPALVLVLLGGIVLAWKSASAVKLTTLSYLGCAFGAILTLVAVDGTLFLFGWDLLLGSAIALVLSDPKARQWNAIRSLIPLAAVSVTGMTAGLLLLVVATSQGVLGPAVANNLHPGLLAAAWWCTAVGTVVVVPLVVIAAAHHDNAHGATLRRLMWCVVIPALGLYAFFRIDLGLLGPQSHQYQMLIAVVGTLTAMFGALASLVRTTRSDRTLALFMVVWGITIEGMGAQTPVSLEGVVLLIPGGVVTLALLVMAISFVDERARRGLEVIGGVWGARRLTALVAIAVLSVGAVPFLPNFLGVFLVTTGAFPAHHFLTLLVIASCAVAVVGFALSLATEMSERQEQDPVPRDATATEMTAVSPILIAAALYGLLPGMLSAIITNVVATFVARLT